MFKVAKGLCCGGCDLLGGPGQVWTSFQALAGQGLRPREMSLEKKQQMRPGGREHRAVLAAVSGEIIQFSLLLFSEI
jgi:hypothetical protein